MKWSMSVRRPPVSHDRAYDSRMLRPFTILLFLVIGLVVTVVLVAFLTRWPLYPYDAGYFSDQPPSTFAQARWRERTPQTWRRVMPQVKILESRGKTHLWIAAGPDAFSQNDHPLPDYRPNLFEIHVDQYGWPFRCMYSEWWHEFNDGTLSRSGDTRLSIGQQTYPVSLMPLGLLANVVILGFGAWLIVAVAAYVRRDLRRRAGKCPQCAYRLGDAIDTGCPECGWGRKTVDKRGRSAIT